MTEFLKIKNWEKFQHYKQRNPPWIKLHIEILQSEDWAMLADASRLLAIVCMLVGSRNQGLVPNNPAYLQRVAYLDKKPNLKPLIDCGFLEKMQAGASKCVQVQADARPETETERDTLPNGNGDSAPLDEDLKTRIFGPAREWLGQQTKKSDRATRTLLGKWCSQYGDAMTLEALCQAAKNAPLDPIPYIEKILRQPNGKSKLTGEARRHADRAAIFAVMGDDLRTVANAPGRSRTITPEDSGSETVARAGGAGTDGDDAGQVVRLRPHVQHSVRTGGSNQGLPGSLGRDAGRLVGKGDPQSGNGLEVGEPAADAGRHPGPGEGRVQVEVQPHDDAAECFEQGGDDGGTHTAATGRTPVKRSGQTSDGRRGTLAAAPAGDLVADFPAGLRRAAE